MPAYTPTNSHSNQTGLAGGADIALYVCAPDITSLSRAPRVQENRINRMSSAVGAQGPMVQRGRRHKGRCLRHPRNRVTRRVRQPQHTALGTETPRSIGAPARMQGVRPGRAQGSSEATPRKARPGAIPQDGRRCAVQREPSGTPPISEALRRLSRHSSVPSPLDESRESSPASLHR